MQRTPTGEPSNVAEAVDPAPTRSKSNAELSDILRHRRRPLLLMLKRDGELLYSSEADTRAADKRKRGDKHSSWSRAAVTEAVQRSTELLHDDLPAPPSIKHLVIDKPGERCALTILDKTLYCLRLFHLHGHDRSAECLCAALVEPIGMPASSELDREKLKDLFGLTNREVDVVDALMSGDTDKQIAAKLAVSVDTVRANLKSIRAKLGVQTRTAIVSAIHERQPGDAV